MGAVAQLAVLLTALLVLAGTTAAASASPPAGAEKWALIVGVDRYQGKTRPNSGSVGDAEEVRAALVRAGWPSDHIRVLTDGAAHAAAVRDGLQWLVDRSSDRSSVVFHYSGHVKQTGRTEFLWPHDNKLIADSELAGYLNRLRGWAWINISGCEAAGFDEGVSGPRRLFTASSEAHEKSYELPPEHRNSVFTSLMVDEAMLQGKGDANRDGRVSVNEGFRYAADRAPGITARQKQGPQHPRLAGGDGSEWFLDPPAATGGRGCLLLCFGR